MKNKILASISFLVVIALMFSACEKPPVEEANEDYDYSKIIPLVSAIAGPTAVAAHGLSEFPYTYSAPTRGGSSWAWTVTTISGAGAAEITLEENGRIAKINFPQRSVVDTATISVIETTMGGVSSVPQTLKVALEAFCPYLWADWAGNYTGTSGSHSDPVVFTATADLNHFKVDGLADFVYSSWGESWTSGDGSCIASFSCGNVFTILNQVIGDSDFPDTYSIEGSGTVDPVNKTISLVYTVSYASGGSVDDITTVLTKSSAKGYKVLETSKPFDIIKK